MTTVAILPEGYPAELTGYADPWIASPGGTVEIKVCTIYDSIPTDACLLNSACICP